MKKILLKAYEHNFWGALLTGIGVALVPFYITYDVGMFIVNFLIVGGITHICYMFVDLVRIEREKRKMNKHSKNNNFK